MMETLRAGPPEGRSGAFVQAGKLYREGSEVIIQSEPVRAWCQSCRSQVTLINVRPWPEGVLVVGECPRCQAALASRKPVGWSAGPAAEKQEPQNA